MHFELFTRLLQQTPSDLADRRLNLEPVEEEVDFRNPHPDCLESEGMLASWSRNVYRKSMYYRLPKVLFGSQNVERRPCRRVRAMHLKAAAAAGIRLACGLSAA